MKTTVAVLSVLAVLSMGVKAQNIDNPPIDDCDETGPHWGDWQIVCPEVQQPGLVEPVQLYGNLSNGPCMPQITLPLCSSGTKSRTGTFDCSQIVTNQSDVLTYRFGDVIWDPPIPTVWEEQHIPSFSSTAYVLGDDGDAEVLCDRLFQLGSVTWTIEGKWHTIGTADLSSIIGAMQAAFDGVKAASKVAPCDVQEMTVNGEVTLKRRTLYCVCTNDQTRLESKVDGKIILIIDKIECPIPTLCLPPLKLKPLGEVKAGVYATFSLRGEAGLQFQVASGCQNDTPCAYGSAGVEAGFKVVAEVCYHSEDVVSASASGSATAAIGISAQCCSGRNGNFTVQVSPLKLAYEVKATLVGWRFSIAKGEENVFNSGLLGPYNFSCPF